MVDIQTLSGSNITPSSATTFTNKTFDAGTVYQGIKYVASDFSVTSSTTLVDVTGLSVTLTAGGVYQFSTQLLTTSNASGGIKAALVAAASLTATTIIAECYVNGGITAQTRISSLGSNIANLASGVSAAEVKANGLIIVNAGGDLRIQFAQGTSNGTASVVKTGSTLSVWRVA